MGSKLTAEQERFYRTLYGYFGPEFDQGEWPKAGEISRAGLLLKESGLFPDLTLKDVDEVYVHFEERFPVQCAA